MREDSCRLQAVSIAAGADRQNRRLRSSAAKLAAEAAQLLRQDETLHSLHKMMAARARRVATSLRVVPEQNSEPAAATVTSTVSPAGNNPRLVRLTRQTFCDAATQQEPLGQIGCGAYINFWLTDFCRPIVKE